MNPPHSAARLSANPLAGYPGGWTLLSEGGTGFVRHDWQEAFANSGLRTIHDFLTVTGDALSKPGLGRRYRARLLVAKDNRPDSVFLKRFGPESWIDRLKGLWRNPGELPAEREVRISEALVAAQLPVPRVLAWGVGSGRAHHQTNFVVLEAVPGQPAHHWLSGVGKGIGAWQRKIKFAEAVALLAARFHGQGWRHRDLYLCHVFIDQTTNALHLIDLQRVFRPCCAARRWMVKDLAQLNFSAPREDITAAMRMRFIKHYFGTGRLTSTHKQLVRQILRKTGRISRHDARRAERFPEGVARLPSEHPA